jgi:hypothetical protein
VYLAVAELHRRLVVRDAADAVRSEPQRVLEQLVVGGIGVDPVLRERSHLDGHEVGQLVAHAQQAAEGRLVLRRDVGVRPDVERPLRGRPADDLGGALEDVVGSQALLQLAPDMDALDQRSRLVVPRPSGGQRGVEVEVTVDQRRRRQPALRVDRLPRVKIELRADAGEAPVLDRNVHDPVADAHISDEEVHRVTVNR